MTITGTNFKPTKSNCRDCGKSFKEVSPYKYTSKNYPKGYFTTFCKACALEYRKKHNKIIQKRGEKFKKELILLKGGKCSVCRYDDLSCLAVFDFHHINPKDKKISIGELKNRYSEKYKKQVQKEITHCILVCSNCHRKIHYGNLII